MGEIRPEPESAQDFHVPVLVCDRGKTPEYWDLTTQQILPYIDGNTHLAKIAAQADVEANLVKVLKYLFLH